MTLRQNKKRLKMNWRFQFFLAVCLILPLVAFQPNLRTASAHAHPALLTMAANEPDTLVKVIVRKSSASADLASDVSSLGGKVTKDLSIINSFVAVLPARSVPALAMNSSVRWISPDAEVSKSSVTAEGGSSGGKGGSGGDLVNTIYNSTTWATDMGSIPENSSSAAFNSTAISSGRYIWFNSAIKLTGISQSTTTALYYDDVTVSFTANNANYSIDIPSATITFSPGLGSSAGTTSYDEVTGHWLTSAPLSYDSQDVFLTGLVYKVPVSFPGSITNVNWSGRFSTDTQGVSITNWKWSAAAYSLLSTDYNTLGVKPCALSTCSAYANTDLAGTPETYKLSVVSGARGTGGTNYTGTYGTLQATTPVVLFKDADNTIDAPEGPNATYGYAGATTGYFTGFSAERTPDTTITQIEAVLRFYVPAAISADVRLTPIVDDNPGSTLTISKTVFNAHVGANNAYTYYIDITGTRSWEWADFDKAIQLKIDQTLLNSTSKVYYDAIGLRVTYSDGNDNSAVINSTAGTTAPVDISNLTNVYNQAIRATDIWNMGNGNGNGNQGQGVNIAVVDSGIIKHKDLKDTVLGSVNFNSGQHSSVDAYGHGTFVAGIIAGSGKQSRGKYMGVAPKAGLVNVRVSDDQGMSYESDVIAGLQWIYNNKNRYNIKVVNISLNSSLAQSYHTSPMCAAAEILWFSGIVVVVSAGNNGTANLYPPANDPFVITVGATDDRGTATIVDDTVATFSAYGTVEGTAKPDLVAPGRNIIAFLPSHNRTTISQLHPNNKVNNNYFRMSGTSMAAPMVSGAVALLLKDEPNLNPDQVKYRLKATARTATNGGWVGYNPTKAGAGYLDIYAAVTGTTTQTANTGTRASQLLWSGSDPVNWGSVNWSSVNWSSVNWSSVNWSSVNWSSVNWSSDTWEP